MRLRECIFINRPIDDVFQLVSDYCNAPKWNPHVHAVEQLTDKALGLGSEYRQIREKDSQRLVVSAFDPPTRIGYETAPGSIPVFAMEFSLEPKDAGTMVSYSWDLGQVRRGFLARLLVRRLAREATSNLRRLKMLLEVGAVALQQDRVRGPSAPHRVRR